MDLDDPESGDNCSSSSCVFHRSPGIKIDEYIYRDTALKRFTSLCFQSWDDHHSDMMIYEYHDRFPSVLSRIQSGDLLDITKEDISFMKRQMLDDALEVEECYLKDFVLECIKDKDHITWAAARSGDEPDFRDLCREAYEEARGTNADRKITDSSFQPAASSYEAAFMRHYAVYRADLMRIGSSDAPSMTLEKAGRNLNEGIDYEVRAFHREANRIAYGITPDDIKESHHETFDLDVHWMIRHFLQKVVHEHQQDFRQDIWPEGQRHPTSGSERLYLYGVICPLYGSIDLCCYNYSPTFTPAGDDLYDRQNIKVTWDIVHDRTYMRG
ncbi:hypothetical protein QBC40DRAFT_262189 [Triangularia verruculosa]|uniref:Uncharacterized protein n=1 Tax=Triangularia verruculosa TaxID=2587418 RepID=A0AAN6XNX2_9PEZI|nr:hypothetical protein QBC40DRAFT_262189 [Triangularia verruculosa]